MKKFLSVLGGLALCGAAALAQAQSSASAPTATKPIAEPQAGFVKSVRGNVQLLSAAGTSRTAIAGDALAAVDRIVTGPDSSASVVLRDDTTLVVGPSSRLDLKEFHFNSTTHEGGVLVSLLVTAAVSFGVSYCVWGRKGGRSTGTGGYAEAGRAYAHMSA